ncbi:hypothetical protein [Bacteroides sp. 224]|uniref:hypothetical protein n=1 Tax=Bacteroides sp. 224 TaxID=2302936 RepID=UPI0013D4DB8D|nr:hypothetical protein [Bacteroides sp. 224]NDV65148.1 hypothetical protein [Bacteroides sp. 224]
MRNDEIVQKLREITKNGNISLSSSISFQIKDEILFIELSDEGVCANMQANESAFEGWALCLKACLPDLIKKVSISWDPLSEKKEELHYKRFLYRVWKFAETYKEWVENGTLYSFDYCKESTEKWIINFPCNDASVDVESDEAILERDYITNHIEYDVINQQLPVGVFDGSISKKNSIMPRGKSQIDIWALKNDTLYIFELKKDSNKMVGIISELMYYVNIMNDVKNGRINYPQEASKSKYRDFDKLYSAFLNGTIKHIEGVFLTDELHPLILHDVINLINLMNDSYQLRTEDHISYSYKPYSE